jgi:polysaccharide biosynthesis/export protein
MSAPVFGGVCLAEAYSAPPLDRLLAGMRHAVVMTLFLGFLGLLAGCASQPRLQSGEVTAVQSGQALPAPDTTSATGAYQGQSDYRIGPLDLLEITVFQVDDLSRKVRVNSSGQISLPLIGAVRAGGKTVAELERDIATALAKDHLRDPQVTVFVEEFTSQRVTVEGAVNKPGIFPITGRTTLLQAIALSEGFSELADEETVVVFRTIEGKKMAALFNIKAIRTGAAEDPVLYGDDIVVVDRSGPRSLFKGILDTLRGFVGFRAI